jgi:hypothetical protein
MPGQSIMQMPTPLINVTLSPAIFQQFIDSQGIRMIHARPVPCPNVRDLYGEDHNPACNECFNGYFYYNKTEFTGAFFGNQLERNFTESRSWDLDQANIVVPVQDTAGNILDVQYFDQIILPEFTVRYYQRVEHSQSGLDRLQFPAVTVDFLIAKGGKIFRPGIDFIVEEGRIRWIGERPGWDASIQRGVVYSVNYYTKPHFTVLQLPHQLRVAQTQSQPGNKNIEARFPQLCVCRKDFIPFDRADKIGEPDRPEPTDGSFV